MISVPGSCQSQPILFMGKPSRNKNICLSLLVVCTIAVLIVPSYHQHDESGLSHTLKHGHPVNIHLSYDDSENSDLKAFKKDSSIGESCKGEYHFHFKKYLHRTGKTYDGDVTIDYDTALSIASNLLAYAPSLANYKHNYYILNYKNKKSAKTSSGLSPPNYSL